MKKPDGAAKRKAESGAKPPAKVGAKRARTTERVNIWLPPDQLAWLKAKRNQSDVIRSLITEAMNMEKLRESVKKK
jgi:hypothetical protein